jgi:predicted TIM-barrel fold metal-dependent hydrolase
MPDKIIDFHVHLFPDNIFEAIWKTFNKQYGIIILYKYYYRQCIEYLAAHDVHYIVYSNYAHKKGIAQWLNTWNKGILHEFANLYCFAAYHPDDENALIYAEEMLSVQKVAGIKLHYMVQQFYPDDERLFPLYEMVIAKGKRLLLHVGTGPVGNEFVGIKRFRNLMKRYPNLPANIYPNLYLDTSFTFWPQAPWVFNLDASLLEKYSDRILYGSDFPNIFLPREDEISYLHKLNLSEAFYKKIFWENGVKLLKGAA